MIAGVHQLVGPRFLRLAIGLTGLTGVAACNQRAPDEAQWACSDADAAPESFDDRTIGCMPDVEAFFDLSGSRIGTSVVKFDVMAFSDPNRRHVRYLDSTFYRLHDEWYYYRLLNGERFEGDSLTEPYPGSFDSIESVYAWAWDRTDLPVGLTWHGERLYARRFYDLAFADNRYVAPGTLIYLPGDEGDGRFAFELEHADNAPYDELVVYFEMLQASLPPEIGETVAWLVRSTEQETLAREMEARDLLYADRILRYGDLVEPGATEVYNPGITAGRLKIVRAGESLNVERDDNVLVLEEVPDWLPPARALLTSVPQTPLAHINLLARSRGIPNASVGGIAYDPAVDALARVSARVAVLAEVGQPLRMAQMTSDEYAHWSSLREVVPKSVPAVAWDEQPYVVDLAELEPVVAEAMRPVLGGKAAGMVALLATPGLDTPFAPLAITGRAYAEHLATLHSYIDAMLQSREFRSAKYRGLRYLVLEGEAAYDREYPSMLAQRDKDELMADDAIDNVLPRIVDAGGLRAMVAKQPIEPETLAIIEMALHEQFSELSATQALRFRSSSSVEDIEGFNGAGLYASFSGYLDPAAVPDPAAAEQTVQAALQAAWASYWGAEAFEERMLARVDHVSGNMGVLVHPRFDDEHELANGVMTLTRIPRRGATAPRYELELNVQRGDVSVTNPDSSHLPEVVRVAGSAAGIDTIERVQWSTMPPFETAVLADADIVALYEQARAVTDGWLDTVNTAVDPARAARALVLDFEFRRMGEAWPSLASGEASHDRNVIKQARTLDPDTSRLPPDVAALPFPRDVLARAAKVERPVCTGDAFVLRVDEALTDPLLAPDLGHAIEPFVARVRLEVMRDIGELELTAGDTIELTHVDLVAVERPSVDEAGFALVADVEPDVAEQTGLRRIELAPDRSWRLTAVDEDVATGMVDGCSSELLYATADLYLYEILAAAEP